MTAQTPPAGNSSQHTDGLVLRGTGTCRNILRHRAPVLLECRCIRPYSRHCGDGLPLLPAVSGQVSAYFRCLRKRAWGPGWHFNSLGMLLPHKSLIRQHHRSRHCGLESNQSTTLTVNRIPRHRQVRADKSYGGMTTEIEGRRNVLLCMGSSKYIHAIGGFFLLEYHRT